MADPTHRDEPDVVLRAARSNEEPLAVLVRHERIGVVVEQSRRRRAPVQPTQRDSGHFRLEVTATSLFNASMSERSALLMAGVCRPVRQPTTSRR